MSDSSEYEFDAETFARAWLAVCTAASDDNERPLLYRTVAVELWPDGVRLTSLDSYMLWTSWVPKMGRHSVTEPTMGELPEQEPIVAFDEDYRGQALLKFAYKIVTAKDASPQNIKLALGPAPLEDGQFPGTELDAVSLSFPADAAIGERVVLATVEGRYPEWRSLITEKPERSTKTVCINPEYLGRIASVKRYWGEAMKFTFTGGPVLLNPLQGLGLAGELIGAVMPVRESERGTPA